MHTSPSLAQIYARTNGITEDRVQLREGLLGTVVTGGKMLFGLARDMTVGFVVSQVANSILAGGKQIVGKATGGKNQVPSDVDIDRATQKYLSTLPPEQAAKMRAKMADIRAGVKQQVGRGQGNGRKTEGMRSSGKPEAPKKSVSGKVEVSDKTMKDRNRIKAQNEAFSKAEQTFSKAEQKKGRYVVKNFADEHNVAAEYFDNLDDAFKSSVERHDNFDFADVFDSETGKVLDVPSKFKTSTEPAVTKEPTPKPTPEAPKPTVSPAIQAARDKLAAEKAKAQSKGAGSGKGKGGSKPSAPVYDEPPLTLPDPEPELTQLPTPAAKITTNPTLLAAKEKLQAAADAQKAASGGRMSDSWMSAMMNKINRGEVTDQSQWESVVEEMKLRYGKDYKDLSKNPNWAIVEKNDPTVSPAEAKKAAKKQAEKDAIAAKEAEKTRKNIEAAQKAEAEAAEKAAEAKAQKDAADKIAKDAKEKADKLAAEEAAQKAEKEAVEKAAERTKELEAKIKNTPLPGEPNPSAKVASEPIPIGIKKKTDPISLFGNKTKETDSTGSVIDDAIKSAEETIETIKAKLPDPGPVKPPVKKISIELGPKKIKLPDPPKPKTAGNTLKDIYNKFQDVKAKGPAELAQNVGSSFAHGYANVLDTIAEHPGKSFVGAAILGALIGGAGHKIAELFQDKTMTDEELRRDIDRNLDRYLKGQHGEVATLARVKVDSQFRRHLVNEIFENTRPKVMRPGQVGPVKKFAKETTKNIASSALKSVETGAKVGAKYAIAKGVNWAFGIPTNTTFTALGGSLLNSGNSKEKTIPGSPHSETDSKNKFMHKYKLTSKKAAERSQLNAYRRGLKDGGKSGEDEDREAVRELISGLGMYPERGNIWQQNLVEIHINGELTNKSPAEAEKYRQRWRTDSNFQKNETARVFAFLKKKMPRQLLGLDSI